MQVGGDHLLRLRSPARALQRHGLPAGQFGQVHVGEIVHLQDQNMIVQCPGLVPAAQFFQTAGLEILVGHQQYLVPQARAQIFRQGLSGAEMLQRLFVLSIRKQPPAQRVMGEHILLGHGVFSTLAGRELLAQQDVQRFFIAARQIQRPAQFDGDILPLVTVLLHKGGRFVGVAVETGHQISLFPHQLAVPGMQGKRLV